MTDEPPTTAQVSGSGALADGIRRALADMPCAQPILVTASDGWDERDHDAVRQKCAAAGVAWLPVRVELSSVVIGPTVLPGQPGCHRCVELRSHLARADEDARDAVRSRHTDALAELASPRLTSAAVTLVAGVVADELHRMPARAHRSRSAVLTLDLDDLDLGVHRFLPDPQCTECGDLPCDDEDAARFTPEHRPKTSPDTYRLRSVVAELDDLVRTYVDDQCGLVRTLSTGDHAGLVVAAAPIGLRGGLVESGYGRTHSYASSKATALLEALERYGGMEPGGRRTSVVASHRELGDDAVDPRTLGLHPEQSYRLPGFRLVPYDDAQPIRWVWGYSFGGRRPVLVPESYAYYRVRDTTPFVYEVSNGCALGGSLEEAAFHGLLEIAERDAFLMTWYTRRPAPRIDIGAVPDTDIPRTVAIIETQTGYRISLFDITVEQEIPAVWAMAVDEHGRQHLPKTVSAAGAHVDRRLAIHNALHELGPILSGHIQGFATERDRAAAMVADPEQVIAMADHSILYGHEDAFPRLDFLTDTSHTTDLADLPGAVPPHHTDLSDDLLDLVDRYRRTGLDVIVVDQTTPEHRAGGFHCVKVIVPGTLPMTFGHAYRRVTDLPRLWHVPRELGYADRPLRPEDLNPHPHPFP